MPEIAEVEIVRLGLDRFAGDTLINVSFGGKLRAQGKESLVQGKKMTRVRRHGKLLGLDFGDNILLAHLRMTGAFLPKAEDHVKARLQFSSGETLFRDPRGFATMDVVESSAWPGDLGPDLWEADSLWLPEKRSSSRSIKAFILDQKIVAGIGNYLADESLWRARVSPKRETSSVSDIEMKEILEGARELSKEVLRLGGVSVRDYVDADGNRGHGAELLNVYGRAGQTCPRCRDKFIKDRVASRGTTWCVSCQT